MGLQPRRGFGGFGGNPFGSMPQQFGSVAGSGQPPHAMGAFGQMPSAAQGQPNLGSGSPSIGMGQANWADAGGRAPAGVPDVRSAMSQSSWQSGGSPYIQSSANDPNVVAQQQAKNQAFIAAHTQTPNPMLANGDLGLSMGSSGAQGVMNQILGAPTNSMGGVQGQNPFMNTTPGAGSYNTPAGVTNPSSLAALYQQQRGTPAFNQGMTSQFGNLYKPTG